MDYERNDKINLIQSPGLRGTQGHSTFGPSIRSEETEFVSIQ